MSAIPVVAMEPVGQLSRALVWGLIGARVGSFTKRGLDEALSALLALVRHDLHETTREVSSKLLSAVPMLLCCVPVSAVVADNVRT